MKTRIDLQVATQIAKFVSRPNLSPIDSKLHNLVFHPQDFPLHDLPWHQHILSSLDHLNLSEAIKKRGLDHPHPAYSLPAPWHPPTSSFIKHTIPRPKSQASATDLLNLERQIHSPKDESDLAILYTLTDLLTVIPTKPTQPSYTRDMSLTPESAMEPLPYKLNYLLLVQLSPIPFC